MKTLFVLKNGIYGYSQGSGQTGLLNSSKFVVDMLNHNGVEAKLVIVTDNNDIDREVDQYKPEVVVIEALWVVPDKFKILKQLHPKVRWIVRVHSAIPFLAEEGMAMDWIFGYLRGGISVAFNSEKTYETFRNIVYDNKNVLYLPNFYPPHKITGPRSGSDDLYIGSFGAIRPLKNQLIQAVAAIQYADSVNKKLRFFVNSSRCEQGGNNVLKNLRGIFHNTRHKLEEVPWMDHDTFLTFLSWMDVAMCVSFTETFCIAAADATVAGAALVCSSEVPWADSFSVVPATDVNAIVKKIKSVISWSGKRTSQHLNLRGLRRFSENSRKIWLTTLGKKKSLFKRFLDY